MPSFLELEPQVLALPQCERVKMIASLLTSLPPDSDEDHGQDSVDIALKRERDAEADPSLILTEEEFWAGASNWRSEVHEHHVS